MTQKNEKASAELRNVICHMRAHNVTCHQTCAWTRSPPAINPANQTVTGFTYTPDGWKAKLVLAVCYSQRCSTCPQTVTHLRSNHLIVSNTTAGSRRLTTSWSQFQHSNRDSQASNNPFTRSSWLDELAIC